MAAAVPACTYLPEELWERIFKIITSLDHFTRCSEELSYSNYYLCPRSSISLNGNNYTLKSLSIVSKQFLSITNRLRFSLKIIDQTVPYLQSLYIRFPNLTCLNFNISSKYGELDELLCQICSFHLDLKTLILSDPNIFTIYTFPAKGLLALSKKMKNLTSLTCSRMNTRIIKNDLFFIADCFPLLEELILTDHGCPRSTRFIHDDDRLLALPKLRKITLSRNVIGIGPQSINDLCKNCNLLQEVKVIENDEWPVQAMWL